MSRQLIGLALLTCLSLSCKGQEPWEDKTRIMPTMLRQVPVALFIQHSPNPNYPVINDTGSNKKWDYVWKHSTTVCSPIMNLKVLSAGSFIWYDESGWKQNVVYNRRDFKKRFECKNGRLEKGSCFTFEENYRYGSKLYGGDALWYVLAEDDNGKMYKGVGIIETEGSTLKN